MAVPRSSPRRATYGLLVSADRLRCCAIDGEAPMKTLITALALTVLVAAPAFSQSAAAAARKTGRDACRSQQNDQCYYRGYPLWQWYSS